jgi:hypothetical protein
MRAMTILTEILYNYKRLCGYCDSFFLGVKQRYKADLKCKKGCYCCCELHSVCALEAHTLAKYLRAGAPPRMKKSKNRRYCALLRNGACIAYPDRPVICRTHGAAD